MTETVGMQPFFFVHFLTTTIFVKGYLTMIIGKIRFSLAFVLLTAFIFVFQATAQDTQEEINKALVGRIFDEIWNQGNLGVVDETIATDVLMSIPPFPDAVGSDAYKATVAGYRAAFPDAQWAIDNMFAQGDMVATRLTATGTQGCVYGHTGHG